MYVCMPVLAFYKCLADDTRLKILLLLVAHKQLCVCDLTDALQSSQPKISRHLADLRKCKLVEAERRGKWMYYHLHPRLPDWAKTVLFTTEASHQSYLEEANRNLTNASATNCQDT